MRFGTPLRSFLLASSLSFLALAGCAIDGSEADLDNEPPLGDLDELMNGAPKADDIPRELGKFDDLLPKKYSDLRSVMSPVKSQGKRGVCSIFSSTGYVEHLYIAAGHPTPDFSEQYLQWSTKFQLNAFPDSSGSNDGINLSAVKQFGVVAESTWPYETIQWSTLEDELCTGEDDQPTHCYTNGHPSDEVKAAQKFFLPQSPRWLSPWDIKAHMFTTKTAVTAGMTFFYQSWNHGKSDLPTNPTYWNEGYVLYPNAKDVEVSTTEEKAAGHAIVLMGWDDDLEVPIVDETGAHVLDAAGQPIVEKGFFIFKNSWGTAGFGIDHELGPGYGYISYRYIQDYASVRYAKKPAPPVLVEICGDGLDNDNDSLTDCADPACSGHPSCADDVIIVSGQGGMSIPDDNDVGISSAADVAGASGTVVTVTIDLAIAHTFRGDLRVELRHDGQAVVLHDRTGGSEHDLVQSFTLNDFAGANPNGRWELAVSDLAAIDVGTLTSWTLRVTMN